MKAARLAAETGALHNQIGNHCQIAQFNQIWGEQVIVKMLFDLLKHPAEAILDQIQPLFPADNPDIIPH